MKTEPVPTPKSEEKKSKKRTRSILSCQKDKTLKLKNIQVHPLVLLLANRPFRVELKIPYSGMHAREGRDFLEKEFEILREGLYGFPFSFTDLEIYPINHSLEVSFGIKELAAVLDNLDYFLTLYPEEDSDLAPDYPVAQASRKANELKILSSEYQFFLYGQHRVEIYAGKGKLEEAIQAIKKNYDSLAIPLEGIRPTENAISF